MDHVASSSFLGEVFAIQSWEGVISKSPVETDEQKPLRAKWSGTGGGNPRAMGEGSLRETREKRAGNGIPKGAAAWRNRNKNFRNRKSTQRRETPRKGAGTGSTVQRTGSRKFRSPVPPAQVA